MILSGKKKFGDFGIVDIFETFLDPAHKGKRNCLT